MKVLLDEQIARYEDSHQIHSVKIVGFGLVTTMKKLSHSLHFIIEGPDDFEQSARDCFNKAAQDGIIAGVAAAFVGAGVASANIAFEVAKVRFMECLGKDFFIKLDTSHTDWVYWDL